MSGSNFKDMVSGVRPAVEVAAIAYTGDINGVGVDTSNASRNAGTSLAFVVNTGVFSGGLDGTNFITVSFEKDDNSGFSSPTAVPASQIYGAQRVSDDADWDLLLNEAADESNSFKVGIRLNDPSNAFYRIVLTEDATVVGVIAANSLLGPDLQPEQA